MLYRPACPIGEGSITIGGSWNDYSDGGNPQNHWFVFANGRLPFIYSCQTLHREDKHMTRAELEINQQDMWRILVFEQRTTLTLALEMLLRCQLSPEQILTKTTTALEGSYQDS